MRIAEALFWGETQLLSRDIPNARMETFWLLSASIQGQARKPLELVLDQDETIAEADQSRFEERILRRVQKYPLAYIMGTQDFMGLELEVSPSVLIPRPETELLAEEALKRIARVSNPLILDVGTGSGCLPIAFAKNRKDAQLCAVDLSQEALELAVKNASRQGVSDRIRFICSDLFSKVEGTFDLVVSNPPYIRTPELSVLQEEVRFEPRLALDGGEDGLAIIRRLVAAVPGNLKIGGWFLMEMGYDQSDAVLGLMEAAGLSELGLVKDYSGIERIAIGRKTKEL